MSSAASAFAVRVTRDVHDALEAGAAPSDLWLTVLEICRDYFEMKRSGKA